MRYSLVQWVEHLPKPTLVKPEPVFRFCLISIIRFWAVVLDAIASVGNVSVVLSALSCVLARLDGLCHHSVLDYIGGVVIGIGDHTSLLPYLPLVKVFRAGLIRG